MHCPRCGIRAAATDRVCTNCGAALGVSEVLAATPATPAAPAAFALPPSPPPAAPEPPAVPAHEAPVAMAPILAHAGTYPSAAELSAHVAHYGGFWRRFVGMLVDGALLFFPQAILRVLLGLDVVALTAEWGDWRVQVSQAAGIVLALGYCTLMESSDAQGTLGQQLMGLRVADMHGRRISFARALGRHFAKLASLLLCGTGYLLQLWTSRRQTLHDLIASCVVVRTPEASAPHSMPDGPYLAGHS